MKRFALLALALGSLAAAPACSKGGKADKAAGESPAPTAESAEVEAPETAEAQLPEVGDPAPSFTTVAHDGTQVSTEALKGEPYVLYFYPRDETPG